MEKKKTAEKTHPHKYPKKIVDEVLTLIKEEKTLDEILGQVQPKKKAVLRYARKAGLEIKK